MASVGKCLGIMAGIGAVTGGASSYYMQSRIDNAMVNQAKAIAKDGSIPIGGMTKDGKMWDGKISVDEYKKTLSQKKTVVSGLTALGSAIGTAIIAGITLALRGKVK